MKPSNTKTKRFPKLHPEFVVRQLRKLYAERGSHNIKTVSTLRLKRHNNFDSPTWWPPSFSVRNWNFDALVILVTLAPPEDSLDSSRQRSVSFTKRQVNNKCIQYSVCKQFYHKYHTWKFPSTICKLLISLWTISISLSALAPPVCSILNNGKKISLEIISRCLIACGLHEQ